MKTTRAQAEQLARQQPRYKVFQDELDGTLGAFEGVQEWPDLIKCLADVNRTLQRHATVSTIPSLLMLSKRLAQCLNSSLPAGVHINTLGTYSYVFQRLGPTLLAQNLGLFASGLFPLLPHSSTRVRPLLLEIYEEYFITLRANLIPALSGFILALLPGIEDPTNETYDRVLCLLVKTREQTNHAVFALCLWRAIVLCPQARLPAINFITSTIPQGDDTLRSYLPANFSIAIEGIIATLHDENVMVGRGMFEILITHFPIQSSVLTYEQVVDILHGALPVLLRREASVNRRFFSWFLADVNSSANILTDDKLDMLTSALLRMMDDGIEKSETISVLIASRPFKLLGLLLERKEINESRLLEKLAGSAICYAYLWQVKFEACHSISMEDTSSQNIFLNEVSDSVLKSAQAFFERIDPDRLWKCLVSMIEEQFSVESIRSSRNLSESINEDSRAETIILVNFALDYLPIIYVKGEGFLEAIVCLVLKGLYTLEWGTGLVSLKCTLRFVLSSLQRLPNGILCLDRTSVLNFLVNFNFPVPQEVILGLPLLAEGHGFSVKHGYLTPSLPDEAVEVTDRIDKERMETISYMFHLYDTILSAETQRAEYSTTDTRQTSNQVISSFFSHLVEFVDSQSPSLSCIGVYHWLDMYGSFEFLHDIAREEKHLFRVASRLWAYLAPEFSSFHFQIAGLLHRAYLLDEKTVLDVIADSMLYESAPDSVDGYRKFSVLWKLMPDIAPDEYTFNSALTLMLDALDDKRPRVRLVARTFVQDSLSQISRIIDPLCMILLDPTTQRNHKFQYFQRYDSAMVLYALRKLLSLLAADHLNLIESLTGQSITEAIRVAFDSSEDRRLTEPQCAGEIRGEVEERREPKNYLNLLVIIALRFIQGIETQTENTDSTEHACHVRSSGVEFLRILLSYTSDPLQSERLSKGVALPLLICLQQSVDMENSIMQIQLLGLLRMIMQLSTCIDDDTTMTANFTSAILTGIRNAHLDFHLHYFGNSVDLTEESLSLLSHWAWFTVSCLPFLSKSLPQIAFKTLSVLCEEVQNQTVITSKGYNSAHQLLLYTVRGIVHHVLLHQSDNVPADSVQVIRESSGGILTPVNFLASIIGGAFSGNDKANPATPSDFQEAKDTVFGIIPVVVEATVFAWGASQMVLGTQATPDKDAVVKNPTRWGISREHHLSVNYTPRKNSHAYLMSSAVSMFHHEEKVKAEILNLLDPLMTKFPSSIIRALLHTWEKAMTIDKSRVNTHKVVLDLLNSFQNGKPKVVIGSLVPLAVSVMEGSSGTRLDGGMLTPLKVHETSALHLLDAYMENCDSVTILDQAWPAVMDLFKKCLSLSQHPFTFLWLLGMIQQYVHRIDVGSLQKRVLKELQDSVQQLLQTCAMFAGQSLTFGISRSSRYVPLPGVLKYRPNLKHGEDEADMPPTAEWLMEDETKLLDLDANDVSEHSLSLIALRSLANVLAVLLDDVWNEEKDKTHGIIALVLPHVLPLLNDHSVENIPNARAVSVLLASLSLSTFTYTVKAWKRDIWAHFLRNDFFRKDLQSLRYWRWVASRMLNQDLSSLNELMGKAQTQGRLFKSHNSDVLERARQLKRLTFAIHAGRKDQYSRYLPKIIEKLVESLKLQKAIQLHAEVLFCVRVLLVRMSPEHLVSIWPVVLTEIMRIFEESNDLELLLHACKFVDMALVILPNEFQLYQWMFIVDRSALEEMSSKNIEVTEFNEFSSFMPYLLLLSKRLGEVLQPKDVLANREGGLRRPMLTMRKINSLDELREFHMTMCQHVSNQSGNSQPPDFDFIDTMLLNDFIAYGDEYATPLE